MLHIHVFATKKVGMEKGLYEDLELKEIIRDFNLNSRQSSEQRNRDASELGKVSSKVRHQ